MYCIFQVGGKFVYVFFKLLGYIIWKVGWNEVIFLKGVVFNGEEFSQRYLERFEQYSWRVG